MLLLNSKLEGVEVSPRKCIFVPENKSDDVMSSANDFISPSYSFSCERGNVSWQAPSNIALVKYWGKKQGQIPANPSVSLTLSDCKTITQVEFLKKENTNAFSFDFLFEGSPKPDFHPKIEQFFERIEKYLPFLKTYHFVIDSKNTFPHSSGIASSASAMAALSLCLMDIERKLIPISEEYFYQKASFLARLGSGSACRSIKGNPVVWGHHNHVPDSSDLFGVELEDIHPIFKNYQDTILLVDVGEKQVSSSLGHKLMHDHPFAERRFEQANQNLTEMISIFKSGNLERFVEIVESEALTLHSMMMTSQPYFILMKPNTLHIINSLWEFRKATQVPACFTLDAGANVHILYPEQYKSQVLDFITNKLADFCHKGQFLIDRIGAGGSKVL